MQKTTDRVEQELVEYLINNCTSTQPYPLEQKQIEGDLKKTAARE